MITGNLSITCLYPQAKAFRSTSFLRIMLTRNFTEKWSIFSRELLKRLTATNLKLKYQIGGAKMTLGNIIIEVNIVIPTS
jgi:hypothetical protein